MNKYWRAIGPKLPKLSQSAGFAAVAGSILFALGIASDSRPAARAQLATTQSPPGVLRVQVDLRSLAIRVTDKQGNDVKGLSADDFTILEDGQPQKISFFGTDNVPTSLNVLVDESGSMDTGKLGSAEAIAARFLRSGRPDDEISAMEFTDLMGPFVCSPSSRFATRLLWSLLPAPVRDRPCSMRLQQSCVT